MRGFAFHDQELAIYFDHLPAGHLFREIASPLLHAFSGASETMNELLVLLPSWEGKPVKAKSFSPLLSQKALSLPG